MRSWMFSLFVTACLILASGCAGVTSLYKSPHRPTRTSDDTSPATVQEALKYADGWIDAYRGALGNGVTFQSYTNAGFLLLSAGALGNNVTSGSVDGTTWLGLGAATTWGLGSQLTNKPRANAYAAGIKAMSCVKNVIAPLQHAANRTVALSASLNRLSASLHRIDANVVEVESTTISVMWETLKQGRLLEAKLSTIGDQAIAYIDEAAADVDTLLVALTADLGNVEGVLQSIQGMYTGITTPPSVPDPTVDGDALRPQSMAALASGLESTNEVRSILEAFEASLPVNAFERCGVDTGLVSDLRIVGSANMTFKAAADQTDSRLIEGGSGRYYATPLPGGLGTPTVSQPTPLGPIVVVETERVPEAGKTYYVVITDTVTARSTTITVTIADADDETH